MSHWPTTRILFLLAGTMTLVSAAMAAVVSPWWLLLSGFVGANQLLFVTVGACPASLMLDRLRSAGSVRPSAEEEPCSSTTTR